MLETLWSLLSYLLTLAQFGLVLLVGMLVMLYFSQEKLLYNCDFPRKDLKFPESNPRGFKHPGERNLPYEEVKVRTEDGCELTGWFIKQTNPKEANTVIYFHENAGNIGGRLACIQNMYQVWGVNVIIVGYRGYGHSTGSPNERGLEIDAQAIFNYAKEHPEVHSQRIFLLGRSLGGAVAIQLVQKVQFEVCGLILENTFTSIPDIVDSIFPFLANFKKLILRMNWPSLERISDIQVPIQFVNGLQDEIVPCVHVDRLHDAAINAEFKQFLSIENGTHNDTWFKGGDRYNQELVKFIRNCREAWTKRNTMTFGSKPEVKEEEEEQVKEGIRKRASREGEENAAVYS